MSRNDPTHISEYEYEDEYDPNDIPIDQRAPETEAPEAAPVTESYVAPAPEPTQPKYDGRVIIVKAIPSSSASSSYKTYKPISISGGPVAPASNPYAAFSWKDPVGDHSYNNDEVGVVLPAVIPIDSVRGSASSYAGGPVPDLELSESSENLALAERDLDLRLQSEDDDGHHPLLIGATLVYLQILVLLSSPIYYCKKQNQIKKLLSVAISSIMYIKGWTLCCAVVC